MQVRPERQRESSQQMGTGCRRGAPPTFVQSSTSYDDGAAYYETKTATVLDKTASSCVYTYGRRGPSPIEEETRKDSKAENISLEPIAC